MSFEAFNWNVVVVGAWNRAILTPQWIGECLFRVPRGTPLAVEVPLNVPGPWRVRHEAVAVIAGGKNLELVAEACNYATLGLAREYADRALAELPRTPVAAAGFNVRYRSSDSPPEFTETFGSGLDAIISSRTLVIKGRGLHRSVAWKNGTLNMQFSVDPEDGSTIEFNFHLGSVVVAELRSWLSLPMTEVEDTIQGMMDAIPGVVYDRAE